VYWESGTTKGVDLRIVAGTFYSSVPARLCGDLCLEVGNQIELSGAIDFTKEFIGVNEFEILYWKCAQEMSMVSVSTLGIEKPWIDLRVIRSQLNFLIVPIYVLRKISWSLSELLLDHHLLKGSPNPSPAIFSKIDSDEVSKFGGDGTSKRISLP
jgi:hypothetical protein